MKVVIARRDGYPQVVDLPPPPLGRGTVIVRASHAAVALPDEIDTLRNVAEELRPDEDGLPLGGMVSGIVEEVGRGVHTIKAGVRVAAYGSPYVYHASHLCVPADRVAELPKKVNHEEGAFAGQGALALNLLRSSGATIGESLLIFGAGMVGMLLAQLARAAGVTPILVTGSEARLTRARNIGITQAVSDDLPSLVREIDTVTRGEGADSAVITADAAADAFDRATQLLRPRGRVILARPDQQFLQPELLMDKELTLRAVSNAGATGLDAAAARDQVRWTLRENMICFLDLLAERRVQVSPLINDRLPLDRCTMLYNKIVDNPDSVLGAILTI